MHIVVVGCGRVGSGLALQLVRDGHSVAVIDKNPSQLRRFLPSGCGIAEVVGFGFDRDELERAGAGHAGALAAVTSGDNSNILTARIARETFQIPAVVARIYDPRRAAIYQRLGIPTVATVPWTIDQVLRSLFPSRIIAEWVDPTGQIELVERTLPKVWAGRQIAAIEECGATVVAVTRAGVARLGAGDLVGQDGDVLYLATDHANAARLEQVLDVGASDLPARAHER